MTTPIRCRTLAAATILLLSAPPPGVAAPPRVATAPRNVDSQQALGELDILLAAGLYTRWPSDLDRSSNDHAALTLGVVGSSSRAAEFEKLASGKQIAGRRVVIRHFPNATDVEPCEILFITRSLERGERLALIQQFAEAPVLLTGETPTFCREGGSLSFHMQDGNVRFTLNHQALAAQKLTVDPRFARLARTPAQAEKKVAPPARPPKVRPNPTEPHTGGNRR